MEIRQWTDELQAKQFQKKFGIAPIYRLRWFFNFKDHKPDSYGGWNSGSQKPNEMAAFKDKNNLSIACIQGEKVGSWVIQNLVTIDGTRFVGFKWVYAASLGGFNPGTFKPTPMVIGMSILTNDEQATVYLDGRVALRKLTDNEKDLKFMSEHSRGV